MPNQTVIATLQSIKYENETTHFCVLNAKVEEENSASTFVGCASGLVIGLKYEFIGEYSHDRRYGLRFQFNQVSLYAKNQSQSLIDYLASSAFKGIGPIAAKQIVDTLGCDCINRIINDPNCLDAVGLSEKQVASLLTTLLYKDNGFNQNIEFLTSVGFNFEQASLVYQRYKESTQTLLKEDPFIPYYQINEIDYHTCEIVAHHLNFESNDDVVLISKLVQRLHVISANSGSTYVDDSILFEFAQRKLNLDEVDYYRLLQEAIDSGWIVLEDNALYLTENYKDEIQIANFLSQFPFEPFDPVDETLVDHAIDELNNKSSFKYDQCQIEAIKKALVQDITFITGGPGSGKTTITKAIVHLCKQLFHTASISAAAPTGRAAKRLSDVLGIHSSTLHSLLAWDKHSNTFRKNQNNPISVEVLIIDEASMLENHLFAALAKAGIGLRKLIFIGDTFQLPSVGVGNLFSDLMQFYPNNVVTLMQNHRQDKHNAIINVAGALVNHDVKVDDFNGNARFIEVEDQHINQAIMQIIQHMKQTNQDLENTVVLAAMHDRVAGIKSLNIEIKPLMNPNLNGPSVSIAYNQFHVGDKVLQIKNDVEQNVFNGDIGTIIDIQTNKKDNKYGKIQVSALFNQQYVLYTMTTLHRLRHGYAMSVHKAQGNEFETVILVCAKAHSAMYNQNLLYTAITRAKKNLIVVGSFDYFIKGGYRQLAKRQTRLIDRLNDAFSETI